MLNNATLIRLNNLVTELSISKSTIWRWSHQGNFPKPITLGPRTIAWETGAVRDWLEEKKEVVTHA